MIAAAENLRFSCRLVEQTENTVDNMKKRFADDNYIAIEV
jgi:hypothetical protein